MSFRSASKIAAVAVGIGTACGGTTSKTPVAATVKRPSVSTEATAQQAAAVATDYGWLEDLSSERTKNWIRARSEHAHRVLATLPGRGELERQVESAVQQGLTPTLYAVHGQELIFGERAGQDDVEQLYAGSISSGQRAVSLPIAFAGKDAAVKLAKVSRSGRWLAASIVALPAENGELWVLDKSTGLWRGPLAKNVVARSLSWSRDEKRVLATVRGLNDKGEPDRHAATYSVLCDVRSNAEEVALKAGIDGVAPAARGENLFAEFLRASDILVGIRLRSAGGAIDVSLRDPRVREWLTVRTDAQRIVNYAVGDKSVFLLAEYDGNRYGIIQAGLAQGKAEAKTLHRGDEGEVLEALAVSNGLVAWASVVSGRGRLRVLSKDPGSPVTVPLPFDGVVQDIVSDETRSRFLVRASGWRHSPRWLELANGKISAIQVGSARPSEVDAVVRETDAVSSDGTRVPVTVISPRGAVGAQRTLMEVYGAYGISILPRYSPTYRVALERGWTIAVGHIRGGAELGPAWQAGGTGVNKVNAVQDTIAVAKMLNEDGISTRGALIARAASAGGVPLAVASVQQPTLFGGVILNAAIVNVSRLLATPIGPANAAEFGVDDARDWSLPLDATRQVRPGQVFASTLVLVSMADERVPPWQSAKLIAQQLDLGAAEDTNLMLAYGAEGHQVARTSSYVQLVSDQMAFAELRVASAKPR